MRFISYSIILFSVVMAILAMNEQMFYYVIDRAMWFLIFVAMTSIIVYLIAQLSRMRQHNITIINTDNSRHTTTNNVLNVSDSMLDRISEKRQRMLAE